MSEFDDEEARAQLWRDEQAQMAEACRRRKAGLVGVARAALDTRWAGFRAFLEERHAVEPLDEGPCDE